MYWIEYTGYARVYRCTRYTGCTRVYRVYWIEYTGYARVYRCTRCTGCTRVYRVYKGVLGVQGKQGCSLTVSGQYVEAYLRH